MQTVLSMLSAIDPGGRRRVVEYVCQRLEINLASSSDISSPPAVERRVLLDAEHHAGVPAPVPEQGRSVRDIRSFKLEKQPRSAIEMAALVAYYLAELAPVGDKKTQINAADVERYFKQADFPLPSRTRKTLAAAKAAGFLDSPSTGSYKLNPVGHNLIVHGLPAVSSKGRA